MDFGYARVSTKEQNEQRQIIALTQFGLSEKCIYVDKQSGKDFERTQYRQLVRKLKDGDTLVIKSIDRLGRKFWSNGASSQRKRVRQSLCWICLCLTHGGTGISPER